uniref:Pyrroline-5-carboxylate reductase catalytic N-terminal domain-containing protein n=1 Tax=Oncorhynchus tshawytscha TaxID=74940 RepID=A0A8C8CP74_ONCTS
MPKEEMERPLLLGGASPRHLKTSMSDPGTPLVGILGTGDFSRSLATSRNPKHCASVFPAEAEVTTQHQAATQADLVFVALFPEHYSTLAGLREPLVGKTLVDVSTGTKINSDKQSNAEQLANIFPESSVVKSFNVISAWTPPQHDAATPMLHCLDCVLRLASQLYFCFIRPEDISPKSTIFAPHVSGIQVHPYATAGKSTFYKIPVEVVNVTLPSVASVTLLSWGTKYRRSPNWLDRWLQQRKQLGLCAFLCSALHAVYSLCLPMRRSARYNLLNAAFKQVRKASEDSWVEEEVWRMELYLSTGIWAFSLCSLPTVGNSLNWREFRFVQSRLYYMALLMATLHTLTYGWGRGLDLEQYRFYLPPTFLLVLVLPLAVLLGRLTLSLPCVALRLSRIRRGWQKSRPLAHVQ